MQKITSNLRKLKLLNRNGIFPSHVIFMKSCPTKFAYRWSDDTLTDYLPWADGFPATDNNGHYCVIQPSKKMVQGPFQM